MTVTLELDDKLVQHGLELGKTQSVETIVSDALQEYVGKRANGSHPPLAGPPQAAATAKYLDEQARQNLIAAMGTIDYDPDYEPKKYRSK